MRRAQLRLRQFGTLSAIALFVVSAAITTIPRPHPGGLMARVVADQSQLMRVLPSGRRWF